MPYKAKKPKAIHGKDVGDLKDSVVDLAKFLEDEFASVASALTDTEAHKIFNAAPKRPRTGMLVYADGTHWNPGNGEGFYFYGSDNAWHYMDVTQLLSPNYGLVASGNKLGVSLSTITASLGGDVALNSTTYTDGPSVAQGTTGTWFVEGTVTFLDTGAARQFSCKLWDGTTVIASAALSTAAANSVGAISLSGRLASPAGNLRISAITGSGTTGKLLFNQSGNSKDCTLTAVRVA